MPPDTNLVFSDFSSIHNFQVVGQVFGKTLVQFEQKRQQRVGINGLCFCPLVGLDMGKGETAQVVVVAWRRHGFLDIDRQGVMAFDQIGVIAIHSGHQSGKASGCCRSKRSIQTGRSLAEFVCQADQRWI